MFKIPSLANQEKLLDLYRTLSQTATKDSKPYILSLAAGKAHEDPLSQGYTIIAKSEFKSLDDMRYYEKECTAHQALKVGAKELGVQGLLTVYYPPEVNVAISA